jgi:hypothetical protein
MRLVELLREDADDFGACGVRQPLQLANVLLECAACARPLERRSNEERPLRGQRDVDRFS